MARGAIVEHSGATVERTADVAWRPILSGTQAAQAREVVAAIATELAAISLAGEPESLAGGSAGVALLYAYLAQAGEPRAATHASRLLDAATAAVATRPMIASLYGGFTGVAWAIAHVGPAGFRLGGPDDGLAAIDAALLRIVRRSPWRRDYDLISGLVGFGVYTLERLPSPAAAATLAAIVARLAEGAERRPEGLAWLTGPHLLPAQTRAEHPGGYYNLGLAHGVPGVIALLGAACAAGVAVDTARPLLDGAVSWLLAQRMPAGGPCQFGYWVAPEARPGASRLAWCYGDLGIAAALLTAARNVAEPGWEAAALAIAGHAAARGADRAGVVDAGLCHGSAGVAHLFNRIYQTSGDERFAVAAERWLAHTLALRRPGQGIGGFCAYDVASGGAMAWLDSPGFLCGAAGIALALLAAVGAVAPAWDRAMLVSTPRPTVFGC